MNMGLKVRREYCLFSSYGPFHGLEKASIHMLTLWRSHINSHIEVDPHEIVFNGPTETYQTSQM